MAVLKIVSALALMAVVSSSCTNGNCDVDDTTSFIQFKQTLMPGDERESNLEETGDEEVVFEKYDLEEDSTTMPAGCEDVGCIGEGPNCGGNELDCTSHGFLVRSYHKSCSHGGDTCKTGMKVRCMQCSASAGGKSATYPTEKPGPAVWTPPPPAATEAPVKVAAPVVPVMPTNAPIYAPAQFDKYAVGNATAALKKAEANVKALKANVTKAEKALKSLRKNITTYEDKEKKAKAEHDSLREDAVEFAKKKEKANITIFDAQKTMSSAYMSKKGAEAAAKNFSAAAESFMNRKLYYQKVIVDAHHATELADDEVELAEDVVKKAQSDLDDAEEAQSWYQKHHHEDNELKLKIREDETKAAQDLAKMRAMEHAFKESTPGRKLHEVPPSGGK